MVFFRRADLAGRRRGAVHVREHVLLVRGESGVDEAELARRHVDAFVSRASRRLAGWTLAGVSKIIACAPAVDSDVLPDSPLPQDQLVDAEATCFELECGSRGDVTKLAAGRRVRVVRFE